MKAEFAKLMTQYNLQTPPNYEMSNRLDKGLKKLDELRQVEAHPEDVLSFMADGLSARDKHRNYLEQVANGKASIEKAKQLYEKEIKDALVEVKQCLNFSMDLALPESMVQKAGDANVSLKFVEINRKIVRNRSFDPKQMPEGCSFAPTATYMFPKLKKEKVAVSVPALPDSGMQKNLQFTFRCTSAGGVEVIVNMVQGKAESTIKQFYIKPEELQEMKRAGPKDEVTLAEGFIVCVSSNLCTLLNKLASGG